jgi:hypothetical protein
LEWIFVGKDECEGRSLPELAFDRDFAAVSFDDAARDG